MKKINIFTLMIFLTAITASAQLKPGDKAIEFKLKGVTDQYVSLSDYKDSKGVIVIFTCNPCPFAKAYEQRIIKLHNRFGPEGYPVVAINPNDVKESPEDTMAKMKERAQEKEYPFPYLKDNKKVFKAYGATRTPHIFFLKNNGNGDFEVAFIGAIDNNAMDAKAVSERYLVNAIIAVEQDKTPDPSQVKAIGCTIKTGS